ncbi:hypothetical protein P5V15_004848 [Pogonomyrmex californicus]
MTYRYTRHSLYKEKTNAILASPAKRDDERAFLLGEQFEVTLSSSTHYRINDIIIYSCNVIIVIANDCRDCHRHFAQRKLPSYITLQISVLAANLSFRAILTERLGGAP